MMDTFIIFELRVSSFNKHRYILFFDEHFELNGEKYTYDTPINTNRKGQIIVNNQVFVPAHFAEINYFIQLDKRIKTMFC